MKLCDRCYKSNGDIVASTDRIEFQHTNEGFDLCLSCSEKVRDFVNGPDGDSVVVGKAKKDLP